MADTEEEFCPDIRYVDEDWFAPSRHGHWGNRKQIGRLLQDIWRYPDADKPASAESAISVEEKVFRKLAEEWSSEIGNVSSLTVMTSHPKYKKIIELGWSAVPYMLIDLQNNRGLWFTALNDITGIRPFDPRDAGDFRRMAAAWIKWGKNKQLI